MSKARANTGKPVPTNPSLYARAKAEVYAKYERPGAYRSLAVVKKYKSLGGHYSGNKASGGLTRWEKEKWRAPGGKKDFNHRKPGVFRPTVKVSKKTPKLLQNVSKKDRAKAVRVKEAKY